MATVNTQKKKKKTFKICGFIKRSSIGVQHYTPESSEADTGHIKDKLKH